MNDFGIGGQALQQVGGVADGADAAVFDHQQAVFEILVGGFDAHFGRVAEAVQEGGAVGFASQRHGGLDSDSVAAT